MLLLALVCAPAVLAQEPLPTPSPTPLTAPPPMKVIPRAERTQLEQTGSDTKQRVRLTISLAATHLGMAEKYTEQSNFDAASAEVGTYHALVENILKHLSSLKRDSNKTRDVYKRLELALRADGPRLTALRRTTPLEFAVWIKVVEDYAREGRTEALNSFYGHTVVREPQKTADDKPKPEPSPEPKSNQP
jgi:hypothetical protein